MSSIDFNSPQAQVAKQFMEHKGLGDVEPWDVDQVEGQHLYYFIYELPEGDLELEVFWNGAEWVTTVTTFTLVI